MIICPKCGNDNPLGRVFCGKCGGKLDFSHTSSQEMASKVETGKWAALWPKLVYLLVILLLIPVALAFWPKTGVAGKPPVSGGERKVDNGVRAVAAIKKGQIVNATFSEEDLNSYLQVIKAKDSADSLSVALMPGYFTVRMVRSMFKLPVKDIVVKLSYEVVCVPVAGGGVVVSKAYMGHLPAVGPLKSIAVKAIHGRVSQDKDWAPFKNITETKSDNGRITITIKP